MAHFVRKSATSIHRIGKYGSFAVLDFQTNCTHGQAPWGCALYGGEA